MCVCVSVGDWKRGEEECGCSRLSISMGVWMFFPHRDIMRVILCEIWRADRAGHTVQRKVQLCNYTIGSWDKWQGCQLSSRYSRSMTSVTEVLKSESCKQKRTHRKAFLLFPHTALCLCLTKGTFTKGTISAWEHKRDSILNQQGFEFLNYQHLLFSHLLWPITLFLFILKGLLSPPKKTYFSPYLYSAIYRSRLIWSTVGRKNCIYS